MECIYVDGSQLWSTMWFDQEQSNLSFIPPSLGGEIWGYGPERDRGQDFKTVHVAAYRTEIYYSHVR